MAGVGPQAASMWAISLVQGATIRAPTWLPTIMRQCRTSSSTLRWLLPSMTP